MSQFQFPVFDLGAYEAASASGKLELGRQVDEICRTTGFLAIANKFQAMIDSGKIPAQYTESQLSQLVFNNRLDAGLTIFFMVVVVVLALYSLKTALAALKEDKPTAKETPYEPMPENLDDIVTQAKGAH